LGDGGKAGIMIGPKSGSGKLNSQRRSDHRYTEVIPRGLILNGRYVGLPSITGIHSDIEHH
jgi:hypothetical protein